jgi:O-antigen ligase
MYKEIYLSFLIQVVSVLVIYFIILRHIKLPLVIRILTLIAYITTPIVQIFSGVASLLYLSDLFFILLLCYLLIRFTIVIRLSNNLFFCLLFLFLIVIPLVNSCILVIVGKYFPAGREMIGMIMWFYRNVNLLITFGVGILASLNAEGIKDFIKINIILGLLLGCLGILNYIGNPINMSAFEILLWQGNIPEWYQNSRVTLGFLGLYRSSVGQWFAMTALFSLGTYGIWKGWFSFIQIITTIISITIVFLSGSRAGIIGIMIGMFMFLILQKRKAIVVILIFLSLVLIFSFFFNSESEMSILWARYQIFQNEDISVESRMVGLQEGVKYLLSHPQSLVLGVGATNMERVNEISGLYGLHNEYIGFIFRAGLLGSILLIIFQVFILKRFIGLNLKVHKAILPIIDTIIIITIVNMIIALSQSFLIHDYATYTLNYYIYLLYGVFIGAKWTPFQYNYNLEHVKYKYKGS